MGAIKDFLWRNTDKVIFSTSIACFVTGVVFAVTGFLIAIASEEITTTLLSLTYGAVGLALIYLSTFMNIVDIRYKSLMEAIGAIHESRQH